MKNHLPFLVTVLLASGCANYKLHVEGPAIADIPPHLGEPTYTLYLIGDAGDAAMNQRPPALVLFQKHLAEAPPNSAAVFLGDNIYPDGLPPRDHPDRALAEHRIRMQLETLKNFKGKAYFIPGNHDWYQPNKRGGVERLEDFVEDYPGVDVEWLPDHGCGDVVTEDFTDNLAGVFVDSEWYLMNWENQHDLHEGCEIRSRENFKFAILEALKKNRRKNVVIFMHHPLHTNGSHGGRFSVKQHLFPLTDLNEKLLVPMPGLGSFFMFLRGILGSRTDTAHPMYRELKKIMEREARKNGSFIFVAGHEHNLQYFEVEGQSYVVSGSGSKTSPVAGGRNLQFGYGKQTGFAVLKFFKEGETFLEFWVADGEGERGRLLFRRQIKGKLPVAAEKIPDEFPDYLNGVDSMSMALLPDVHTGGLHRLILGDHYRLAWKTSVKAPVLDLASWRGGVVPLKRGGGSQTNSLRVEDPQGHQWVLRDLRKDETRIVPYPFNKTFARGLFADQFTAAHPYAAFTISTLAEAADIYHTNPRLYYIPRQPRLGPFNVDFGDRLYLVEERADDAWTDNPSFGFSKNLISTLDLVEKLEKSGKHRIDAASVVRARLFDNLIGDWDRHDDNWRWASFPDGELIVYRPVPRDRDQPFSKWDGLVPAVARLGVPFLKQLRPYSGDVSNVKWLNYHSKYFDATFLSQADWSVWEREALHLQKAITDEVIDRAMHDFPREIQPLDTAWIAHRLRQRKQNLPDIARRFYLLQAKSVDVVGTEDHDFFLVERLDDEHTRVRVYDSNKAGNRKGEPRFDRTFLTSETKEIRLYGLDQEDHFHITGKVNRGPLVRCVGGLDDDTFRDESSVKGLLHKTHFYDSRSGNHMFPGSEAAVRTTNDPVMNTYDRRSWDYEHNFGMGLPFLLANPDDGLSIGGAYVRTLYGFHRSPYAQRHSLFGSYAFETASTELRYQAEFIRAIRRWDLLATVHLQTPLYTRNFYGFGNDSPNWLEDEQFDDDFVRVRQERYGFYPALRRNLANNLSITLGTHLEMVRIEDNPDRLVNRLNPEIYQTAFKANYYSGAEIDLSYFNADNPAQPTTGLRFRFTAGFQKTLAKGAGSVRYLGGETGIYLGSRRVVVATMAGGRLVSDGFQFYQAAVLGGRNHLRGYRNERFTGQAMFFHQAELRLRLANIENQFMPFSLGVFAAYDYGRVWYASKSPGGWHDARGGGLWLSPLDLSVITLSYFRSEDGPWFEIKGGFGF